MTAVKSRRESLWLFALSFCYALAMLLATVGSRRVVESARNGMRLAVEIILPSVLPFMIFSEIAVAAIRQVALSATCILSPFFKMIFISFLHCIFLDYF